MRVRGPNNVGANVGAVQTEPIMLRYFSATKETKEMLGVVGSKV